MKRKHIMCAILMIGVAITLSAAAVGATACWDPQGLADWMYNVGRHKIWMTNYIVVNELKPAVERIEAVLGDPSTVPGRTWTTITDALADIKLEIEWIKVTAGLIATEVQTIEHKLDETVIPNLDEIKLKLDELVIPKLDNITLKVDEIELKLDDTVIPLLGQGLVGESTGALYDVGNVTTGDGWTAGIGFVDVGYPEGHPKKYSLWVDLGEIPLGVTMRFELYYDSTAGGIAEKIGAWKWGGGDAWGSIGISESMVADFGSGWLIVDQLPVSYDSVYVLASQEGGESFEFYWHYILEEN